MASLLLAAALVFGTPGGPAAEVSASPETVDPGRSVFVDIVLRSPGGDALLPPDIGSRVRGFSSAEDFAEDPVRLPGGGVERKIRWRLVPEPAAESYWIAPFAVVSESGASFVAGPVKFSKKPLAEASGAMETEIEKDLPPLTWKLAGWIALAVAAVLLVAAGAWFVLVRTARRVKEHFLSPVERAWAELSRLEKRRLPAKGKFKDFYVELTLVVRRYVQRRYGIRAPHMTTDEFFREVAGASGLPASRCAGLVEFLRSADLVKFAGVEADEETADAASESARAFIANDWKASEWDPGK